MISRGTLLCRSNSADVNVGLGNRGGEDVLSRHGVRKGNVEQMAEKKMKRVVVSIYF